VQSAAWALPVSAAAPTALGDAAGAGSLLITLGSGLQAHWQGLLVSPALLISTQILSSPSSFLLTSDALAPGARQNFSLWNDSASRRTSLEITFAKPARVVFASYPTPGLNVVEVSGGVAQPRLDRPLSVGAEPIGNPIGVTYYLLQSTASLDLFLGSPTVADNSLGPTAMALTNALLVTTRIRGLSLNGPVTVDGLIDNGTLDLYLGLYQIVPTLPDPYAANFEPVLNRDAPDATTGVHVQVQWSQPDAPAMTVELTCSFGDFGSVLPGSVVPSQRNGFLEEFSSWLGGVPFDGWTLLDVSSNADQLGVTMAPTGRVGPALTIQDLSLSTAALNTRSFLLPQFQWEPVHNLPNPLTTDPPITLESPTDGSAAIVGANSVRLVPIAPIPVAAELVRAYREDGAPTAILFTLPFGIEAVALFDKKAPNFHPAPDLMLLQPPFTDLTGAREFSLRAGTQVTAVKVEPISIQRPVLPGATRQLGNVSPAPTPDLNSVLGTLRGDFNSTFSQEVPIQRADLSGYGANIFSNWINDSQQPVHISQVAFDAFHGRTSYERIQLTSILWPCQATMVRTITLERYGNASIIRWDSGWVATTPGLFAHRFASVTFHPGVVQGMYNIREVRDTDRIITLAGAPTADVQAVYFDADIAIEGVQRGQDSQGRVPAYRQLGFIQRIHVPAGVDGVGALSAANLNDLFTREGPIGGPIDCVIKLGQSQQQMRVTGVFSGRAPVDQFAVAVYGSPVFLAAGQWSVVRVQNEVAGPVPAEGVPLVREGPAKSGPSVKPLRWADPGDLLVPPVADYAFLFTGNSQRILYTRPKVESLDSNITSVLPPLLADPYAMLRAGGVFPKVLEAISFDQPYPLSAASGLLKFVPDVVNFSAPAPPGFQRPLADLTKWLADLNYGVTQGNPPKFTPTQFLIDTAKNWGVNVQGVSQILSFDPLGQVMTIVHDMNSPADGSDDFPKPSVVFAPVLDAVKDLLTLLQSMSPDNDPGGLPAPLSLSLSLDGSDFRLSATVTFTLEGPDGEAINCGAGKLRGQLQIGAELTADILKSKFGGKIFLQIQGDYQQLIFPFIYGGGHLNFLIGVDQSGTTTVNLDACTMGSVGGTVIPFLVDLEATVHYGYFIGFEGGTFQPGIVLGMDGRANLASGLLAFSFGVEGRLLIERLKLPGDIAHPTSSSVDVRGDILVSGSVTVAWAIHERKSFHATYHQTLGWEFLVGAALGFVPIP